MPVAAGQVLDRRVNEWKDISTDNAPSPRLYADAHAYQGRILIFGGITGREFACNDDSNKVSGLTDGRFYSPSSGKWEDDVSVPEGLIPGAAPEFTGSWLVKNHLVVRLTHNEGSRIVALNLDTGTWKTVFDAVAGASQLQVAKVKNGLAVIHYKSDAEKPSILKLTRIFGESLEKTAVSEAYLPGVFNLIYVKHDAPSSDSQHFLAIGLKSGDSIMNTSIQFAVDVTGSLKLQPLPIFGSSLVEWVDVEKGFVGLCHDGLGKVIAVYLDKKSGATRKISGIDIEYNQYTVVRAYKNKVYFTMGLDKARSYMLELPNQDQ
ncbi:MAG TPA: hypothetical protein VE954_31520 [Oligoflexus sp.]|uniref:hypothetical protein n=1 Tax=Oligoflexus sp. TaxID=1971216 RepID=UPI002D4B108A|nr:hypothetical protein [Oligoflexus sp.]HYX37655.1 hypothetical protein [Oligoflexus sp.]